MRFASEELESYLEFEQEFTIFFEDLETCTSTFKSRMITLTI
jgi:hypothetical protein